MIASRGRERGIAVLDELKALGGEAEFVRADVSDARDVETLVTSVLARFGRLDVAVNNAGAIEVGVFKPLADFDEPEFDEHIALNMKSVWLCMNVRNQSDARTGRRRHRQHLDRSRGSVARRRAHSTPPQKQLSSRSPNRRPSSTQHGTFASTPSCPGPSPPRC